ncbi:hypothetical protein B0T20DRAFT_350750 [Sordaria brevicollis]|uniref:Uncharacterized protein n=1 Tax=Sordaria brevicollis TaxID=83679 RepID=A0AAE0PH08_SORBR|nr:hypothetical protein B0T20DRAFT_350750 [Sordaria brevicollis]
MVGLPNLRLLARGIIFDGPIDGFDPNISNGTCYRKSASGIKLLPSDYIACGNAALGHVGCCQINDKCLGFGTCYNKKYGTTYMAGCTDKEYQDANCPYNYYSAAVWSGMIYCEDDKKWMPCMQNDFPEYVTQSAANCETSKVCPNTDVPPVFSTYTGDPIPDVGWVSFPTGGSTLSWLVADATAVYHKPSTTSIPTITSSGDLEGSQATPTSDTVSSTSSPTSPTSVPPGPTATSSTEDSSNLSTGAIVGIGVGVGSLALLLLAGLAIFFILRRRRAGSERGQSGTSGSPNAAGDELGKESESPISPGGKPQDLHASPIVNELDPQTDRPWSFRSELHENTVTPSAFSPATTSHASFQPSPLLSEASEGQGYATGHAYKPYGGDHLHHINELPG